MPQTLFIGNLASHVTEQELLELFKTYEITNMYLPTNPHDGSLRGFGFMQIKTAKRAKQMIQHFNYTQFKGKLLQIKPARTRLKKTPY